MNERPVTCEVNFPYKEDVGGSIPSAPTHYSTLSRTYPAMFVNVSLEVGAAGERQDVPSPTYVYRAFDVSGQLLYVGMTADLVKRISDHQSKHWIWDVESLTAEVFPTRRKARAAEIRAIRTEHPRWNVEHSVNKHKVRAELWAMDPWNPANFGPHRPPRDWDDWIILGRKLRRLTWPIQYGITLPPFDGAEVIYY